MPQSAKGADWQQPEMNDRKPEASGGKTTDG
jgi:hypothetical protein